MRSVSSARTVLSNGTVSFSLAVSMSGNCSCISTISFGSGNNRLQKITVDLAFRVLQRRDQ